MTDTTTSGIGTQIEKSSTHEQKMQFPGPSFEDESYKPSFWLEDGWLRWAFTGVGVLALLYYSPEICTGLFYLGWFVLACIFVPIILVLKFIEFLFWICGYPLNFWAKLALYLGSTVIVFLYFFLERQSTPSNTVSNNRQRCDNSAYIAHQMEIREANAKVRHYELLAELRNRPSHWYWWT